jgi:hypothetical protein
MKNPTQANPNRRPWKVFVHDVGPSWSFATEEAAERRAVEACGEYAHVSVYESGADAPVPMIRWLWTAGPECPIVARQEFTPKGWVTV